MAEYGVDDSPLWFRYADEIGMADAEALGLSDALREDLREWNEKWEGLAADDSDSAPPAQELSPAHRVTAFALASRVQTELGDDVDVWCAAGDGIGRHPELRITTFIVVSAEYTGSTVEVWKGSKYELLTVRELGGSDNAAKAIVAWRHHTERTDPPLGNAETRSAGLLAAGMLQQDLGSRATVVFCAGARSQDDYAAVRKRYL
jgi:hypothetical protein